MNAVTLSETANLSRVIQPERGDLPAEAAEATLHINFDPADGPTSTNWPRRTKPAS